MVAKNPDFLLKRAADTAQHAVTRLQRSGGEVTTMGVMADAVRAMNFAMNAVLVAAGISPDDERRVTRIREDVVAGGVLTEETVRLYFDATSFKTRFTYSEDPPDPDQAMKLLGLANEFIERTRQAVVERVPQGDAIRKTEGVVGGKARVRNTRIPVWTLVQYKKLGRVDSDLLNDFPGLTADDLDAVWDYYRCHAAEIEQEIAAEAGED